MASTVRAAGGLVCRRGPGGLEVLLVHRPKYDDWSFPKGKARPDEPDEACALREVEEETGLRCELGRELETSRYVDSRGRSKRVRYWAMRPLGGGFEPDDEIDEVRWLTADDAEGLLSYPRDRSLLRSLPENEGCRILLVRHARAGDRDGWEDDDLHRPLDARGRGQAEALVGELARFPIGRLVSSPAVRCVQTFEPLARALGLPIEERAELGEGAGRETVLALVDEVAEDDAALCTHGDVLELLLGDPLKKGETAVAEPGLRVVERIRIRRA